MSQFDLVVVGGGPAGFFTTINIAKNSSLKVALIEKSSHFLTKFKLAGSGKCNLTHAGDWDHFSSHYGANARSFKRYFYGFDNWALLDYFQELGFDFYEREDGKYFPECESGKELAEALVNEANRFGVQLFKNSQLTKIDRLNDSSFSLEVLKQEEISTFTCKQLVLATGGKSYPNTGSDGKVFSLLSHLGIEISPLHQSLSPVLIKDFTLGELSGLSFKGATLSYLLTSTQEGKKPKRVTKTGDLLITPEGFSGPLILNNARDLAPSMEIKIGFLTDLVDEIKEKLQEARSQMAKKQIASVVASLGIPLNLAKKICPNPELKMADASNKIIELIATALCAESYTIKSLGGWNKAMATAGGLSWNEIDLSRLSSVKYANLFFAGEMLDLDGDTGGYNLQAAFSTAAWVAKAVLNN